MHARAFRPGQNQFFSTGQNGQIERDPINQHALTHCLVRCQQFMLGNYSFQIKAVDTDNGSIIEGYQFAKPVVITMFFDVDKLVQSNKKVVSGISQQDVRPVLLLWNVHKKSWYGISSDICFKNIEIFAFFN